MIRQKTLELLGTRGGVDTARIADDTYLYDAGLTSFGSMQLMLALEEHFGIEFPETMLNRRTFSSLANITAAVGELVGQKV